MTIKDILAKVTKGEALTAEEKAFAESYDPQQALDGVAAAARKKAEADLTKATQDLAASQQALKDLQTKLDDSGNKGKSQLEQLQTQVAALTKQIGEETAAKAKLIRQQKLDDVIRGSGLQFVKEVDGNIMRRALEQEFGPLTDDDLAVADKVKPVLTTFAARNKAVILDTSGHGAGGSPHTPGGSPEASDAEHMTTEQRAKWIAEKTAPKR